MDNRPLEGIRVVELGTYVAVPTAARMMADWGADVIKVEAPSGDYYRTHAGRFFRLPDSEDFNVIFQPMNANKRDICLNLKAPEGKDALMKLLSTADIFITNTRPKPLEKLGFGYEILKEKFPRLICGYFSGFGEQGPDKDRAGFDTAAFWARGGALVDWAVAESTPSKPFPGFADGATSAAFLSGLLAALYHRERTGLGDAVNISLLGTSLWFNNASVITGQERFGNTFPKSRYAQSDPMAPLYKTADGDYLLITETNWDTKHDRILTLIGQEAYVGDPRFATLETVRQHMPEVVKIIEAGFAKTPTAVIMAGLVELDTVHEKLASPADLCKDQQAWANDYLREVTFPGGETVVYPNNPVQFGSVPTPDYQLAPKLGEHTAEILKELGYSDREITTMAEAKAAVVR